MAGNKFENNDNKSKEHESDQQEKTGQSEESKKTIVDLADPASARDHRMATKSKNSTIEDGFQIVEKKRVAVPYPDEFKSEHRLGSQSWARFVLRYPQEYRQMFDEHWRDTILRSATSGDWKHPLELEQKGVLKCQSGHAVEDLLDSHFKRSQVSSDRLNELANRLGFENGKIRFANQQSAADQAGHDAFVEFSKGGKRYLLPIDISNHAKNGKDNVVLFSNADFAADGRTPNQTALDRMFTQLEAYAKKGVVEAPQFYDRLLKCGSLSETIALMENWGKHLKAQNGLENEGQRILGERIVNGGEGQCPLNFHRRLLRTMNQMVDEDISRAGNSTDTLPPRTPSPARRSPFEGKRELVPAVAADSSNESRSPVDRPLSPAELESRVEKKIERLKAEGKTPELIEAWAKTLADLKNPGTKENTAELLNKRIAETRLARARRGAGGAIGGAAAVFIVADYLEHLYDKVQQN